MTVPGAGSVDSAGGLAYGVRVTKLAQQAQRAEGEAAVALIEGTKVPPGLQGQGTHINTHA